MILRATQTLSAPLSEVFPFFADAHNLALITPPWLRFQILTKGNIEMRAGTVIEYRIGLGPVPLGWTSEISAYEPMNRFVDEQRRGPYRHWVHEHRFTADGVRTVVEDTVNYLNPGGRVVHRLFVGPQLRRIFDHRSRTLRSIFGDDGASELALLRDEAAVNAGCSIPRPSAYNGDPT